MVLPTDDVPLVRAAKHGDLYAFQELVERHRLRVYRVALRLLGNPSDAEDAAQEAFVQAWRALPAFRVESEVSTWLYRIVTNRCLNLTRTRSQRPVTQLPADLASPNQNPEQTAETTEELDTIKQAILELTPEQRTALVLREFEGLSYEEIAQVLETTVAAVKGRVHRARLELLEKVRGR